MINKKAKKDRKIKHNKIKQACLNSGWMLMKCEYSFYYKRFNLKKNENELLILDSYRIFLKIQFFLHLFVSDPVFVFLFHKRA